MSGHTPGTDGDLLTEETGLRRVPHPIPQKRCIAVQGALSIFRWTSKNVCV